MKGEITNGKSIAASRIQQLGEVLQVHLLRTAHTWEGESTPLGTVDSNLKGPKQVSQIYTQGP